MSMMREALLLLSAALVFGCGGDGGTDPACVDGERNGDETDVDCGGSCDPCGIGD